MSVRDPNGTFNSEPAEYTPQQPRRRRRWCSSRRDGPLGPKVTRGLLGHLGRRWRRTGIPANHSRDRQRRARLAILLCGKPLLRALSVAGDGAKRLLSGLESLHDRLGVAGTSRQSGLQVDSHELDVRRSAERNRWLASKGDLKEIADHRRRHVATCLAMAERRRIVEADIH